MEPGAELCRCRLVVAVLLPRRGLLPLLPRWGMELPLPLPWRRRRGRDVVRHVRAPSSCPLPGRSTPRGVVVLAMTVEPSWRPRAGSAGGREVCSLAGACGSGEDAASGDDADEAGSATTTVPMTTTTAPLGPPDPVVEEALVDPEDLVMDAEECASGPPPARTSSPGTARTTSRSTCPCRPRTSSPARSAERPSPRNVGGPGRSTRPGPP